MNTTIVGNGAPAPSPYEVLNNFQSDIESSGGICRQTGLPHLKTNGGVEMLVAYVDSLSANQGAGSPIGFEAEVPDTPEVATTAPRLEPNVLAVCFIDVMGFKAFNEAYGHEGGDKVIGLVASAINESGSIRGGDKVFRNGGDEFVILLPIHQDSNSSAPEVHESIKTAIKTKLDAKLAEMWLEQNTLSRSEHPGSPELHIGLSTVPIAQLLEVQDSNWPSSKEKNAAVWSMLEKYITIADADLDKSATQRQAGRLLLATMDRKFSAV